MAQLVVSSATSKGSINIWSVNMCGGCHNPIIRKCVIEGEASGNGMGYGYGPYARQESGASAQISAEKHLKEYLLQTSQDLLNLKMHKKYNYNEELVYSLLGSDGITLSYVKHEECPYCNHIDRWLKPFYEDNLANQCPQTEIPKFSTSYENALEWAKSNGIMLKKMMVLQNSVSEDRIEVEKNRLLEQIQMLKTEMELPEITERIKTLRKQYWDLKSQKLPFYKINEKNKQKQNLLQIEKEQHELEKIRENEQDRLKNEIHQAKCKIEELCQQVRGLGMQVQELELLGTTTLIPYKADETPSVFCEL